MRGVIRGTGCPELRVLCHLIREPGRRRTNGGARETLAPRGFAREDFLQRFTKFQLRPLRIYFPIVTSPIL